MSRKNKFGRIITIGSVQEAKPHPQMLVYSATKAAQTNMMKSLSLQLAEDNITVIGKETPSSVEVINLSGAVVAKAQNTDNISIDYLAKGHYIVRVNIDNTISTHRIIKK